MRNILVFIPMFLGSLGLTHLHAQDVSPRKTSVIYDTDMGNDVDDVLALAMLHNYHKAGTIDLLGITISKANPYAVPYTQFVNSYYGRPDVPIGYVYEGATPGPGNYIRQTLEAIGGYGRKLKTSDLTKQGIPEGYKLLRKLLASEPDGSVILVVVGFHTNIARLLQSKPDEFSRLDGVALVRRKVRLLSVMAGDFEQQRAEYNVKMDIAAARQVFDEWPGEIIVSGYETGRRITYPVSSILNDFDDRNNHPVPVSYQFYRRMPYENATWDLLSVLQAAEPEKGYFDLSKHGRVVCDSNGITTFVVNPKGKHRLHVPSTAAMDIVKKRRLLVSRVTGDMNSGEREWHPKASIKQFSDGISHWNYMSDMAGAGYDRFSPDESIYIADNLVLYQNQDGGWPKNIDWLAKLDPKEVIGALPQERHKRSTLDNRNTYSQVAYLAHLYTETGVDKFRESADRGIDYILAAQNRSGGWRGWDVDAITYNDDVMIGTMQLLRDIVDDKPDYYWVSEKKREQIKKALDRAIDVTLRAQIVVNGKKTGWCQQHDHQTLMPTKARTYELPAICPMETTSIIRFLMKLEHPDNRIKEAIEAAVIWLDEAKITGLRIDNVPVDESRKGEFRVGYDRVEVSDPNAPALWARFHEISDNRPFMANRDGKKVYHLQDVEPERRVGYSWYSTGPQVIFDKDYPAWKKKFSQPIIDLYPVLEFPLGADAGDVKAVPVQLSPEEAGILVVYNSGRGVGSPNPQFFVFPDGTYNFVLFDSKGRELWRKDLGKHVIPDGNFCPVFPFDLDGDGAEEIWFVNNTDKYRPLASKKYVVEKLDPATGNSLGSFPFPMISDKQPMGNLFRLFLMGGYASGKPVLLTGQGTYAYGPMAVHAYNPDLSERWRLEIPVGAKGARGSHMSPMVDMDNDGDDELLWGERCIRISDGSYLFVADYDRYTGHSDVVQPVMNRKEKRWYLYTCRENGEQPRLVFFNDKGERIWTDLTGHVDIGWVATFSPKGKVVAAAYEIDRKFADGFEWVRTNGREYFYDVFTGERLDPPFEGFVASIPVDVNGDGVHELFSGGKLYSYDGSVTELPHRGGLILASKLTDHPGEHLLTIDREGMIRIWVDRNADDTEVAKWRYSHPFYKRNQKLTASGSNKRNLGGL
ncbi:pectate lyase [Parapedobacter sp. 2B3]|uniref:pectate lyase n=1 Tax=Parapedobacter sp. 2B3 TaxID=3342381 RepID=UPI0035B63F31